MADDGNAPIYWGSYKGRIIKAIALDGAKTWQDLQELTGLSPKSINSALAELFGTDTIYKTKDNHYRVARDIFQQYLDFFKNKSHETQEALKVKEESQGKIKREFQSWLEFKKTNITENHLFLAGGDLEDLAKHMVNNVQKELLIVSPYIDRTSIMDSIKLRAEDGVKVRVLTRNPERIERNNAKINFINNLSEYGVDVNTNEAVHAKILVFDRGVSLMSSMNLYAHSVGGASWEAGIVTTSTDVLNEILTTVDSKFSERETKRWSTDSN